MIIKVKSGGQIEWAGMWVGAPTETWGIGEMSRLPYHVLFQRRHLGPPRSSSSSSPNSKFNRKSSPPLPMVSYKLLSTLEWGFCAKAERGDPIPP